MIDLLEKELLPLPAAGAAATSSLSVLPFVVYSILGRNASVIATPRDEDAGLGIERVPRGSDFRDLQDFRQFHPMGAGRPLGELRRGSQVEVYPEESAPGEIPFEPGELERIKREYRQGPLKRLNSLSGRTQFKDPQWVVICLKRAIRRQVLSAMGVIGHRGLAGPKMKWHSKVVC